MTTNSDTRRRPRTPAGGNPPLIARDVARLVACAEETVRVLTCCKTVTVHNVINHLLNTLQRYLGDEYENVVVRGAVDYAKQHYRSGKHEFTADLGELQSVLMSVLLKTDAPGNLTSTIELLVSRGIDGTRITWDVITRESLKHVGLIHKECNRLARILPSQDPDELKGYGWAGLRTALLNYQPELGYAFSTYACPKINGAIRDGVRAESPIPKRLTTFMRKVSKVEEQLTHELSRPPTYQEISEFVDSTESMHLLPRLVPTASIEELAVGREGEHAKEPTCLIAEDDTESAAMLRLRDEALRQAVAALPQEQADVIELVMLQEMPVGRAATQLGIDTRQLRLRREAGLAALAPVMRAWLDDHSMVA